MRCGEIPTHGTTKLPLHEKHKQAPIKTFHVLQFTLYLTTTTEETSC
ncbi:hypothetical protein HDE80_000381 [Rhodanobacter sp. A1T4]|nr:hypothetical protein [Rhodanobacter sp. A1T4]